MGRLIVYCKRIETQDLASLQLYFITLVVEVVPSLKGLSLS